MLSGAQRLRRLSAHHASMRSSGVWTAWGLSFREWTAISIACTLLWGLWLLAAYWGVDYWSAEPVIDYLFYFGYNLQFLSSSNDWNQIKPEFFNKRPIASPSRTLSQPNKYLHITTRLIDRLFSHRSHLETKTPVGKAKERHKVVVFGRRNACLRNDKHARRVDEQTSTSTLYCIGLPYLCTLITIDVPERFSNLLCPGRTSFCLCLWYHKQDFGAGLILFCNVLILLSSPSTNVAAVTNL